MHGLIAFREWYQEPVLQKIKSFLNRVVCRAIVDMQRSGLYKNESATMWWTLGQNNPDKLQVHCNEVNKLHIRVLHCTLD